MIYNELLITFNKMADELLKSNSIVELRDLVYSLEKDAEGKKTELQHMVGSKYHDFIQSADKISKMKSSSKKVEGMITDFWSQNADLIAKVQKLLVLTLPDNQQYSKNVHNTAFKGNLYYICSS